MSPFILKRTKGFTLIEMMVAVAMLGIITMIAIPRLSLFLARMQVDNQISELHRLVLTARNIAINENANVVLCPLDGNSCVNRWQETLIVFVDNNNNQKMDGNDRIVIVKQGLNNNDKLLFDREDIRYAPTGLLNNTGGPFYFKYCPQDYPEFSRGIAINNSGRTTVSIDIDNDGIDEFPSLGSDVTCS